jgi:hypothetical protein
MEMLGSGKFRGFENHITERELEKRLGGWVMLRESLRRSKMR